MILKQLVWLFITVWFVEAANEVTYSYEEALSQLDTFTNETITATCFLQLKQLAEDFQKSRIWALQMVDSSSKFPSGIFRGNFIEMGDYDECLSVNEPSLDVNGKFCKTTLNLADHLIEGLPKHRKINTAGVPFEADVVIGIQMYLCVPKSCNAEDLDTFFNDKLKFDDRTCLSTNLSPDLDALAIFAIAFFSVIALIVLVSTTYDLYLERRGTVAIHPAALAFSLLTNGKKLFKSTKSEQLSSLNGMKSLSTLWVVIGHVYMTYSFVPLKNYMYLYEWLKASRSQFITGATVSVDTFLVIGGFLTVYTFLATSDKGKKFNVPMYYFHRYLRLTPALAAILLAHVALFNYFGSGPIWKNTDTFLVKGCKEYWWSSLLYIQNYVNPNAICIPQSWYLSVDMQLFLVSPLILIPLRRWPLWTCIGLGVISVGSIIGSFLLAWFLQLSGVLTVQGDGSIDMYMKYVYMPTHTRMVPYLFGIILGFVVYKFKKGEFKLRISKINVFVAWTISLTLLAICVFSGQNLETHNYNRLGSSFFVALIRPTWSIAVCWVIFACSMNLGGPVDQFLSMSIFQLISKLSYSIYLVHYSFLFMTSFTIRTPLVFSDYDAFHKFWGDLAFTFVLSVAWTLIFESPIITLEKLILGGGAKRSAIKPTLKSSSPV